MPEYRTNTRPAPFNRCSAAWMADWRSGISAKSRLCATFTFMSTCGTADMALASSDIGFPVRFISERICNAEIRPSPVVL